MNLKRLSTGVAGDGLSFMAGALLTLAFAPFSVIPLAFLSPAMLLGLWLSVSVKQAFWRGFLFGVGFFGTGVYWVYNSIHTYGDVSVAIASFITLGFVLILALFPASQGWLLTRFFPKNNIFKLLFAFPASWVLFEWLRSWILTGFPWLFLGYSQIHTPLKGYAPLLSVYGVTLVMTMTSAMIVMTCMHWQQRATLKRPWMLILLLWVMGGILCFIPWTKPNSTPVKVSLVQGNIPQSLKWSDSELQTTLDRYENMTTPHWDSRIIVWPESAIPVPLHESLDYIQKMADAAKDHHTTLVLGIPIKAIDKDGYYNAVVATGAGEGVYLKRRLVPFGEFIPFKPLVKRIMDHLNIPMSDMITEPHPPETLNAAGLKIFALICYEVAYPELALNRSPDIGLLMTISNDGWFDHSIAQAQHLQIAQMRAIEMRRPLLFVGNTGMTAIINAFGNIQSSIPPFESEVLTDNVIPRTGRTLWQITAMDPILVLSLLMFGLAVKMRRID